MLAKGELSTGDFLDCVLTVLGDRAEPGRRRAVLRPGAAGRRAVEPGGAGAAPAGPAGRGGRARAPTSPTTAPRRCSTLAWAASTPEHFELLDDAAADDVDLAWRVHGPARLAGPVRRGRGRGAARPRPRPGRRSCAPGASSAARPVEEAKAEAWERVWRDRAVPAGLAADRVRRAASGGRSSTSCWCPWAHRYLDEVTELSGGGLLAARRPGPRTCGRPPATTAWLDARARTWRTASDGVAPGSVRTELLTRVRGADDPHPGARRGR